MCLMCTYVSFSRNSSIISFRSFRTVTFFFFNTYLFTVFFFHHCVAGCIMRVMEVCVNITNNNRSIPFKDVSNNNNIISVPLDRVCNKLIIYS